MAPTLWVHNGSVELDNESRYKQIMAVSITLTIIMSVVVSLRAYVRAFMLKTLGADDWVIFVTALCNITYTGLCIGQTRWGLGLPTARRPKADLNNWAELNFAGKPIYIAGIFGFKISLCLAYLRILKNSSPRYRKTIWFVLITCVIAHLAGILMLILECTPAKKGWRPLTPGHCMTIADTVYVGSATAIFYDLVILILPIPMIMKLQMNTRKKVGLGGLFFLGIFTTVCSIMRLTQVKSIISGADVTGIILWATVEMNVGVTLTCLPTLLPLVKYFSEKIRTTDLSSYPLESRGSTILKSGKSGKSGRSGRSRIRSINKYQDWHDRESLDNSSQNTILRQQGSASESVVEDLSGKIPNQGILATTKVEIHSCDATDAELARETTKKMGGKW